MNELIARRAALALSAFAFVVSVASAPVSAFASNDQGPPPAPKTPTPYTIYPPDIQVTSLGLIHHADTPDGYLFRVKNIGQGPAKTVTLYEETKIYKRVGNAFIKKDTFQFVHPSPVNPGGEFLVEVSCHAHGPEYCDYGSLGVVVTNVVPDSNVANNYAKDTEDSNGKPTL